MARTRRRLALLGSGRRERRSRGARRGPCRDPSARVGLVARVAKGAHRVGIHRERGPRFVAARDDAPVEDQPLIDALVELYTASSPTEALASLPLDVALRALRYLHFTTTAAARTKLQVAATLCERIDEATSSAESREVALLAAGLVLWLEDAAGQVMALSAASRERLARLTDGLLRAMWAGRNPHLRRDDDAYEVAKAVGDEKTARLIAEEAPRVEGELKSFVARQALEWIARRESHR